MVHIKKQNKTKSSNKRNPPVAHDANLQDGVQTPLTKEVLPNLVPAHLSAFLLGFSLTNSLLPGGLQPSFKTQLHL